MVQSTWESLFELLINNSFSWCLQNWSFHAGLGSWFQSSVSLRLQDFYRHNRSSLLESERSYPFPRHKKFLFQQRSLSFRRLCFQHFSGFIGQLKQWCFKLDNLLLLIRFQRFILESFAWEKRYTKSKTCYSSDCWAYLFVLILDPRNAHLKLRLKDLYKSQSQFQ